MAEEEAEVEELLKQIALAKQKELRLRAEKKRIRDELGQLQAGALWSREEQTQRQLLDVRRAKEQLEVQKKAEEEKLTKLRDNLKEQELKFRKGISAKPSPFQQAASTVVTTSSQLNEGSNQTGNAGVLVKVTYDTIPILAADKQKAESLLLPPAGSIGGNQETNTPEYDALQQLIRNINCDEQQKKIGRLQAELEKANSRRREVDFDVLPSVMTKHTCGVTDVFPSPNMYQDRHYLSEPGSNAHGIRTIRKSVSKLSHLEPLDGSHPPNTPPRADTVPATSTHPANNVPSAPVPQQAVLSAAPSPMYPPQFAVPGWSQNYPVSTISVAPYSLFLPPILPANPYGMGFPSPYFPNCPYPAVPPWPPSSGSYPYQVGNLPAPEHSSKPTYNQQEEDVRRLERELEMQRITNEQKAEAKEFARLQNHLQDLQSKISTLTAADNLCAASMDEVAADDKDDCALKSLKKQHLESVVKVRNERDLLEEQEKLEELKERIQRRRDEKKRELDHEDWVAKQKRELVALRLQRAIQQDAVKTDGLSTDIQGDSTTPYNPDSGFALFWDFVAGVPVTANNLQITYAVFDGKIIRTSFKVVYDKETKAIGPQHKLSLFLSSRHIKKLPSSSDLRVIIEVASVIQNGADGPRTPMTLGWTAFGMFKDASEGELILDCGSFKLPVKQSSMPDPLKTLVLPPTIEECGDMRIHIRVVHGANVDKASQMLVDPELHAERYQLPDVAKVLHRPQSKGMMSRRPSIQDRRTSSDKPNTAFDDQKVIPPSASIERQSDSLPTALPQKQDFLDVDRLRLLSSASSRPPSTRPRSNIPPSGDISRLPPFREDSDAETEEPWIRVDKTELQRRLLGGNPFQPGDGFNVYIDGGRGFPDNVSISKVTVAALHADRTQLAAENGSAFATPMSDAFDPLYDAYVEYRQNNFNPTMTLVIRVDTIELISKQPVILGYSVFPVFLDVETHDQPTRPSIPQFVLNEGGFQLPLHSQLQSAEENIPLSAKSCNEFPRIPCATVLLRISRAKLSGDGLTLLSRKDFPSHEWESNGLLTLAPSYYDKFYDSQRCVPSGIEEKIYSIRHKTRKPKTVSQCLQQMSLGTSEVHDALKAKPPNYLDLSSALRYEPAIGFRIAIDSLHNVKAKAGPFFKVLFSVYPPGSFYQSIRLTGDVYFTTTMDWTSAQTSPEFGDGYMTLRDSPSDPLLVVLFDVRSLARHPKTGAITSQQYGWTFLPVLAHSRSVNTCSIQLPLFQGEVNLGVLKAGIGGLSALIDDIGNQKTKQLVPVSESGASLFVRLQDPQMPQLSTQPMAEASLSKMVPPRLSTKYAYDTTKITALKKKTLLSKLLPSNFTDKQLEKELNQAFAQEMDIHHLLF